MSQKEESTLESSPESTTTISSDNSSTDPPSPRALSKSEPEWPISQSSESSSEEIFDASNKIILHIRSQRLQRATEDPCALLRLASVLRRLARSRRCFSPGLKVEEGEQDENLRVLERNLKYLDIFLTLLNAGYNLLMEVKKEVERRELERASTDAAIYIVPEQDEFLIPLRHQAKCSRFTEREFAQLCSMIRLRVASGRRVFPLNRVVHEVKQARYQKEIPDFKLKGRIVYWKKFLKFALVKVDKNFGTVNEEYWRDLEAHKVADHVLDDEDKERKR
ncbi:hypothetical protein G7Y89_g13567 [Cudoniella acicularis]|uniref:Uncharacterized protein n=1 Tax=Cudoniella acicularis TaxID=354080 RepID=A0A8H4R9L3_9HELO|nr:hypothetical protein G7Y89_g13567 [Cudoniella acicularis]